MLYSHFVLGDIAMGDSADNNPQESVVTLLRKSESIEASSAAVSEDAFTGLYWGADNTEGTILLPPYPITTLETLVEENNALDPCISAYEVNIDGSGYVIEKDGTELDTSKKLGTKDQGYIDFFKEISPGVSFITLRKRLRRELERSGVGYLEVVRNVKNEIIFVNVLASNMMRLVKLGEPVSVKKKIKRFGKEVEISLMVRERLFAQQVGTNIIYFKEFGASRDVGRKSGKWSKDKLGLAERGNEIIYFTVNTAANSPYGVPRWISQVPSVVGSRKAEEVNLDFFDSGGIPPIMVFIAGGMLSDEVRKQLENVFNAKAKNSNRGAVIEVQPTGGSLDKDSKADVKVEKFGSDKMSDSMFENYDEKCEKRVRKSYRLPPLFVGLSEDYNYATAYASYMIAEAQVFKPERDEFDETINNTIMVALDDTGSYKVRSKQISIKDIDTQLKALGMLKGMDGVDETSWVDTINEVGSIEVGYDEDKAEEEKTFRRDLLTTAGNQKESGSVEKAIASDILPLIDDFLEAMNLVETEKTFTEAERYMLMERIQTLNRGDRRLFDAVFTTRVLPADFHDIVGARELCGCIIDTSTKQ